jgi:hypothetical protein
MAVVINQVPIRKTRPPMITGALPIPTAVLMIIQITLEIRPPSSPLRRFGVTFFPLSRADPYRVRDSMPGRTAPAQ